MFGYVWFVLSLSSMTTEAVRLLATGTGMDCYRVSDAASRQSLVDLPSAGGSLPNASRVAQTASLLCRRMPFGRTWRFESLADFQSATRQTGSLRWWHCQDARISQTELRIGLPTGPHLRYEAGRANR